MTSSAAVLKAGPSLPVQKRLMNASNTFVKMVPTARYVPGRSDHVAAFHHSTFCFPFSVQDIFDGFLCECPNGWTGLLCSNDIDECRVQPCENGGTCYVCDCTFPVRV